MNSSEKFSSRFVRVGPYKTHYIEKGDGYPVLFIHGGGPGACGEFGWYNVVPVIGKYARAIAIDQIGFGLTDKPLDREYTHQFMVEHISRFIDTLCIDELHIVGNSLGAYIAARYALDHPGRVKKLLLVASGTIGTAMGIERGMTPKAGQSEGMKTLTSYDGTKEGLGRFIRGIMYRPENFTDERLEKRWEYAKQPGIREAQKSFLNFFQHTRLDDQNWKQWFDLKHRLPYLTIPIHFVWGRHDIFADPSVGAEMEQMLPNATFEWFEEAGHLVQNDDPESFNRSALKFLFDVEI